jgi:hypothetical protein
LPLLFFLSFPQSLPCAKSNGESAVAFRSHHHKSRHSERREEPLYWLLLHLLLLYFAKLCSLRELCVKAFAVACSTGLAGAFRPLKSAARKRGFSPGYAADHRHGETPPWLTVRATVNHSVATVPLTARNTVNPGFIDNSSTLPGMISTIRLSQGAPSCDQPSASSFWPPLSHF